MRTTISVIKADIGSIGGHSTPSKEIIEEVRNFVSQSDLITDFRVFNIGDDISILMAHNLGKGNSDVHRLAWDAFTAGTAVARKQGLYGAGQDLLADSFSGNVKGLGQAAAEIEMEERANEPFVVSTVEPPSNCAK